MASAGGKVGVYTLGIFDVQNPSETEQNTAWFRPWLHAPPT